ncbi:MAG TPA: hypothetical protein VLI69_06485 [Gammaproteobacteria bacterium]|nr:hypothetical protein [Gammaproteobacteria bacterium]
MKKEKKPASFECKKNFYSATSSEIFFNFFTEDDVDNIIKLLFKNQCKIQKTELCILLNNVTRFVSMMRHKKLKPGKTDNANIIEKIFDHAKELKKYIDILAKQYGYEPVGEITLAMRENQVLKNMSLNDFLEKLANDLFYLSFARAAVEKRIDASPGKRTGGNSRDSIPNLILNLISVYERITDKTAEENFQQDPTEDPPYVGQFYEFLHLIFKIINENYSIRYPNTKEPNPFRIDFENENKEKSHSLGKYVRKVFESLLVSEIDF